MIKSSHRVQHTLSAAFTEYCIHCVRHHHKMDCLPLPASLSSLARPCCTQFSTLPQLQVNQWIESELPSHLPPKRPPPDWPPPSSPSISLNHGLQVHLQTGSITASMCISKLAWLRRPPSSHDYGLQVHPQTSSNTASKLAGSRPRNASLSSLDHGVVKQWR